MDAFPHQHANVGKVGETVRIHTVCLKPANFVLQIAENDPILGRAEAFGVEMPNSCRNGTCRTCICKLESGSVTYAIEWPGLSREEKLEGYILPCVARPASDLVIDAPRARKISF